MGAIKVDDPIEVQKYIASKKGYLSSEDMQAQENGVVHNLAHLSRLCRVNFGNRYSQIYYAEHRREFDEVYGEGKWRMCKYCRK